MVPFTTAFTCMYSKNLRNQMSRLLNEIYIPLPVSYSSEVLEGKDKVVNTYHPTIDL